jgi:flagellar hook-associated protein 3 FlgL
MRISTSQIYQQGLSAMLDQQANLTKTQQQLSTGRRILTPADDPAGSAQALDLNQVIEVTKQYQDNAIAARVRLGLEESTLTGVSDLLQRVRELAVQANNATQTNETRAAIALEVRQRLTQLLDLANTRDANNEYLFAGYKGQVRPFASTGTGFTYSGDQGARYLQVGPSTQIAVGDSGADVFMAIRNGNGTFTTQNNTANTGTGIIDPGTVSGTFVRDTYTIAFTQVLPTDPVTYSVTGVTSGAVLTNVAYTSGANIVFNGVQVKVEGTPANGDSFTVSPSANQDIFTTVQNFINALGTTVSSPASRANVNNAMNRTLTDMDQALGNIIAVRTRVGARLNTIDSQQDTNDAYTLQVQQTLSQIQDLDYAEAASRLNLQQTILQAAQQAFIKVQGLSLFNFLR